MTTEIVSDVEIKQEIEQTLLDTLKTVGSYYYFYYLYIDQGVVVEKTIRFRLGNYETEKDRPETDLERELKQELTDHIVELIEEYVSDWPWTKVIVHFNAAKADVSIKNG